MKGDPQIEQAKAGDDTADRTVRGEVAELRPKMEEGIVVPKTWPPGKDQHEDAEIEAHSDAKKELKPPQPHRGRLLKFWQRLGLRLSRAGGELRGKQIRLMQHLFGTDERRSSRNMPESSS